MEDALTHSTGRRRWDWSWWLLASLAGLAVWFLWNHEDAIDPEFPMVDRPTYSRYPPAAYRLAEPGDTLDRVGTYLASWTTVVALLGCVRAIRRRDGSILAWLGAVGLSLAAFWYCANPSPTFDGWHGLSWSAIADPEAPVALKLVLGAAAASVSLSTATALVWLLRRAGGLAPLIETARRWRVAGLFVAAVALALVRVVEPMTGWVEPVGFWGRFALVGGLTAWSFGLVRVTRQTRPAKRRPWLAMSGLVAGWLALMAGGLALSWLHRPLARLRVVEPGKIYISAMPTYRGLEVAHARHGFKTIVNLFPENTPQGSPLAEDERRFARERGIRLVENPDVDERGDDYIDATLGLARDPASWPLLVHCHACMDRTPAWMGLYRFLVQGRPLRSIFQEIEQHRGCRPKASVTLLYTHLLGERAPERFAADPIGQDLRRRSGRALEHFRSLTPAALQAAGPPPRNPGESEVVPR